MNMGNEDVAGSPVVNPGAARATPPQVAVAEWSDEFMTKKELAARLKVTERTVDNWRRRGVLPFVKVGKVVIFQWSDVVQQLKANFRVCRRTW
jgi:excisionase family DNA binding protein